LLTITVSAFFSWKN